MRHPSEYTTTPLGALRVMQVDAGTVVTDKRTGEKITINDETSAFKGHVMFCTSKVYEALKAHAFQQSGGPDA